MAARQREWTTLVWPNQANEQHTYLDIVFNRAYRRGRWYTLWATVARHRTTTLLDIHTLVGERTVHGEHFVGQQTVPVAQIQGSEGRSAEFDRAFHPRQRHTRERWLRVAQAWFDGRELAPVELLRIGDVYVVRDGHHRISVAIAFGQHEIDALVTVYEVNDTTRTRSMPCCILTSCLDT